MKKLLKILFSLVIVSYFASLAYLYYFQRDLVYIPPKGISLHPVQSYSMGATEDVFIKSGDGLKIHAWYNKPESVCDKIILYLHGNSDILAQRKEKLDKLRELGYGYFIPSWRGFGKSEGFPTRDGLIKDAHAAVKFLQDKGYDLENQVVLIGESLGTGVASEIATQYKFHGLMLLGAYTSIVDMGKHRYPLLPIKLLLKENFDTIGNIKKINTPVLFVHGKRDHVIPVKFASNLFAAANEPKKMMIYDDVRHTDFNNSVIFDEMEKFFEWNCSALLAIKKSGEEVVAG